MRRGGASGRRGRHVIASSEHRAGLRRARLRRGDTQRAAGCAIASPRGPGCTRDGARGGWVHHQGPRAA
eukprot:4993304-Lingulodinium_polyedra.AAC.1